MAGYFELKHQTEKIMLESAALAEQIGFRTAAENLREQVELFLRKELAAVAAGEAKRGKSSLLNAVLNENPPLFPVDVNICTNVVTVVRYGEKEKIEVHIEDSGAKGGVRIESITRDRIAEYVSESGNPGNYKNVRMIHAAVPNELLKEGVVFVDTPGVGSRNMAHAETTYAFLPNADLLLFVSDTVSGMTESELNFLKRGYRYCDSVLFALTKKDLNADYEEILSDNREKISGALGIPQEDVQITPVSSMAKLRYLKTGSKTMYENSNYAAFEERLWTMIAKRRGEVLLMPFLMAAKSELLHLMENVAAQYQLLDADQGVVHRLMDDLNQKTAALEDLQEKGADWRGQLALFFSRLQNEIASRQRRLGESARTLLDECAKKLDTRICSESNYSQIICAINDVIGQGVVDIREEIARKMEEKSDELYRQMDMGVYVDAEVLKRMGYRPQGEIQVVFPPKKKLDTAIKWGRNIAMNTTGGGMIGGVLGAFVGFCLGGPAGAALGMAWGGELGGLAGGAKGCVDSITKYDQLDVNTVMKELTRHINNSMADIGTIASNTIAELRVSLTSSFEQQLKKQMKQLKENSAQIQKNIHLAADEIPKKRAALEQQDVQLKMQIGKYEKLETAIEEFASTVCVRMPQGRMKEKAVGQEGHGRPSVRMPQKEMEEKAVRREYIGAAEQEAQKGLEKQKSQEGRESQGDKESEGEVSYRFL